MTNLTVACPSWITQALDRKSQLLDSVIKMQKLYVKSITFLLIVVKTYAVIESKKGEKRMQPPNSNKKESFSKA